MTRAQSPPHRRVGARAPGARRFRLVVTEPSRGCQPTVGKRNHRGIMTTTTLSRPDQSVLDLAVAGILDEQAGRALLRAVAEATDAGWHRVEVDLRLVSAHTSLGTAAVTKLCRTGSRLPGGIGFSVASGPSQRALLASLADA